MLKGKTFYLRKFGRQDSDGVSLEEQIACVRNAGCCWLRRLWTGMKDGVSHFWAAVCLAPGPVNTEFFMRNNPEGSSERQRKLQRIPLGRFAEADDIAKSVAFFLGEDAGYITGQTLFVDGGSSLASSALF